MPSYVVHYFEGYRAMAEPIEALLTYAGAAFQRKRIPRPDWPQHKANYPRGKVPVLEVDGEMLCEVSVILKYLGDSFGLVPKGAWDSAMAAEVAASYADLYINIYLFITIPAGHKEERAGFVKEKASSYARPFLADMEKRLGNPSGWLFHQVA